MTEDQFGPSMSQWRSQHLPPPLPRLTPAMSAMSTMSTSSEASFGNVPPRATRHTSQSRLGRSEEVDEEDDVKLGGGPVNQRYGAPRGMTRAPSQGVQPSVPYPYPPPMRSRSASSPNVYQAPKISSALSFPYTANNESWSSAAPPPETLAMSSSNSHAGGTAYFAKRMSGGKRSSGESNSTETSETSSQQSPATPYGTIPGDSRGATPVSRQNSQDGVEQCSSMLVKVRCGEVSSLIRRRA